MNSALQKGWSYLQRTNDYWKNKTQPIKGGSADEKLQALETYLDLDEGEKSKLTELRQQEDGEDFIARKIEDINDYASHRTAFIANAIAQFLIVNLSSVSLLSFVPDTWFKVLMVGGNLIIAFIAWRRISLAKSQLLNGPSEEPEWSFWGMFRGNRRKHNQHIKKQAQAYKIRMRDERLFSIMYLVNAVTIFFASQLILTEYLPAIIRGIINIPLFIISLLDKLKL